MRAVVQRVTEASVVIDGETVGAISDGLCVLLGVSVDDTEADADYITESLTAIRAHGFEGAALCWNLMQAPEAHIEAVAGLERDPD